MEYEKPIMLDVNLGQEDPQISPMGFIVLVLILVAGVTILAGIVMVDAAAVVNVAIAASVAVAEKNT